LEYYSSSSKMEYKFPVFLIKNKNNFNGNIILILILILILIKNIKN
jgi:hypothetical protein